jgi:hypothetical protein
MKRVKLANNLERQSPANRDPFLRLCAAITKNAISDLKSKDPVISLDALDWLLLDAPEYLRVLGFSINPDDIFTKAVTNG